MAAALLRRTRLLIPAFCKGYKISPSSIIEELFVGEVMNEIYSSTLIAALISKWIQEHNLGVLMCNEAVDNAEVLDLAYAVIYLKQNLVGLYLCYCGDLMDTINRAYQHCQATKRELEIVLVYLPFMDDPQHFKDFVFTAFWLRGYHLGGYCPSTTLQATGCGNFLGLRTFLGMTGSSLYDLKAIFLELKVAKGQ